MTMRLGVTFLLTAEGLRKKATVLASGLDAMMC